MTLRRVRELIFDATRVSFNSVRTKPIIVAAAIMFAGTAAAQTAETAAAQTQTVQPFQRKRPSRKPFPDHLPRERIVIAVPESCPCCGSAKLSKLGEDIPRRWR